MSRIRFTPQAKQDLDSVYEHIAQDSPRAAGRVIDEIERKCRLVVDFPDMGSPCEQIRPGLRSFFVKGYVVYYRAVSDGIEIVRVAHAARDLPSLFPE